jgi:two-component system, OmpR family, phosphate regulon sensor histidine kinase PhoR
MSRARVVVRSAVGAIAVLALISSLWTGLRALAMAALPAAAPGASAFLRELAIYAASLVAFGLLMSLLSLVMRKGKRHDYFTEMSAAFRRIARGDFDVAVRVADRGGGTPFGMVAGELNEMTKALKRMEELRQEFISTVSHDIQSPLASITGFAKALREEGLPAQARAHYLDIIEAESGRLSRLSDDLLRLTALEARKPRTEPYRLDEQIRSVVLASEPQWRGKGLELELDLEELRIEADPDMLFQAWANLLHNAVKFSPQGGRLALSLRAEGGLALFRIEDEGIGIASEDLPFVFDRFFKADRSRSRADPSAGSGLGLAIVKKIALLHGGDAKAESGGPGKGSAFTVSLPLGGPPEGGA